LKVIFKYFLLNVVDTLHIILQIIIGEGKNSDDFVYVDNVVHGHICAMKALSTKVGAKLCGGQV
jgi:sterol-4alpha-carboxylate 3-dehydrogenase (decarboxylating)